MSKKICPNKILWRAPQPWCHKLHTSHPLKNSNSPPHNNQKAPRLMLHLFHLFPHSPSLPQNSFPTVKREKTNRSQLEVRPHSPSADKEPSRSRRLKRKKTIFEKAAALCTVDPEAINDFQIKKALKPLLDFEKKKKKKKSLKSL